MPDLRQIEKLVLGETDFIDFPGSRETAMENLSSVCQRIFPGTSAKGMFIDDSDHLIYEVHLIGGTNGFPVFRILESENKLRLTRSSGLKV